MQKPLIQRRRTWQRGRVIVSLVMLFSFLLTGCTGQIPPVPVLLKASESFSVNIQDTYRNQVAGTDPVLSFPAAARCVPTAQDEAQAEWPVNAAFLFNLTDGKVLFTQNCYDKVYPASTTKLLTAFCLLSYVKEQGIPLSETYVIQEDNCGITRVGAKLFGFQKGDVVSLELLLNALLVYSANDAAIAIMEYIAAHSGVAYEEAVDAMNTTAARIGATHTHFTNPHGLHESEHKTTAYDLYLIFMACMDYGEFLPIVMQPSYLAQYTGADGGAKEKMLESTNQYFLGLYTPPNGVEVYGGKTGSTGVAGDCFVMLSESGGKRYLSAVFGASSYENLYQRMNVLLEMELSDDMKK